jgi:hypothetical protein
VSNERTAGGSHRAPARWDTLQSRVSGGSLAGWWQLACSIVEKRHLSTCTIPIMQYYMVALAAGTECAKGFRLIIFPADQNAPGVWL